MNSPAIGVNIGRFYFIVVIDFVVRAVAPGGWGGNTPGSVEESYRIAAQLAAYVVLPGLLKNVKVGEKVDFTLHPDGMNSTVTAIAPVQP